MDLEGCAKRALTNREDPFTKLVDAIIEIKGRSRRDAEALARAIIIEAKYTIDTDDEILVLPKSGITMGDSGVGSRGMGDFYVHRKIAEVIGRTNAIVDSTDMDDAGIVEAGGKLLIVTVDGMHSRLSDFPFIAGFHATRAALRDVYVMGARPSAIFSDIHVADGGDIAKVFEYTAGISAVSESMEIPLITGSTLRIGGDMVIGERMTGCVGAVGISDEMTPRKDAEAGDVILMTEGSGGGTICTAALYHRKQDVVEETLNIRFLRACQSLIDAGLTKKIHAMTDVTNGGIRGDAFEISRTAGVKLAFDGEILQSLVNPKVMRMLCECGIDHLGVSLDALLIISPEEVAEEVKALLNDKIRIEEVGWVEKGSNSEIIIDGVRRELVPKFRESAYTPVKSVVDEIPGKDWDEMKNKIDEAAKASIEKKKKAIAMLERDV